MRARSQGGYNRPRRDRRGERYRGFVVLGKGERVYVHCQRGEDRTGTFIRLLRACGEASRQEYRVYGGSKYAALDSLYEALK